MAQQQVQASVGSNGAILGLTNIKAPKNGYAYVYISNQSNNDVYFDDLLVGVTSGNIIEENHYYAYGLKIATLSSRKLGNSYEGQVKNNYLYNDKELFEDADLNWYDYGFRYYDPQIGRFPQLDPLTFEYQYLTPYQYASCDPITNIDVDGLEGESAVGGLGKAARDFTYISNTSSLLFSPPIRTATGVASKAGSAGASLGKAFKIGAKAVEVSNKINTNIITRKVGNPSESTCQGCSIDKSILAPPEYRPDEIRPCHSCPPIDRTDDTPNLRTPESDPIAPQIKRDNIAIIEGSPTNDFPIIGNLKRSGKYKLMGYDDEAEGALKDAIVEGVTIYLGGSLIRVLKFRVKGPNPKSRTFTNSYTLGTDLNKADQVLQRGGQSLTEKTLKALELTKEQGRNAIHALKKDLGLGNNYHGVIRGNGDYYDPTNKIWKGNLFDYL